MIKRCPHCQTRPLRADAEACWYCGKAYGAQRKPRRTVASATKTRLAPPVLRRARVELDDLGAR